MKAKLDSRKSVRINWFKQENVSFIKKRTIQWSYSNYNIELDVITPEIYINYVFSGIKNPIPGTNMIIFADGLPHAYMHTSGSIGDKFLTDKSLNNDVEAVDRIVRIDRGEEKVSKKPVQPHEAHLYKEIQIHERQDKIIRKLTLKNESPKLIRDFELTFIETKEIRFISSNPVPSEKDVPEYKWKIEIPPEGSVAIELNLENYIKNTYKIEKEKDKSDKNLPHQPRSMHNINEIK
ncbi:MAG: hypothetical protein EAX96_07790 [Candidatus Lokiarchaeota archaeon]|nr:hypothetical protein [Candidatus Lokiarchaeota archaeon]